MSLPSGRLSGHFSEAACRRILSDTPQLAAAEISLFRFVHKRGPLAGQSYWATPGGALEEGETFQQAAIRELREETGLECSQVSAEIARREFVLQLANGEYVNAEERYFVVRSDAESLSFVGWTDLEVEVVAEHNRCPF